MKSPTAPPFEHVGEIAALAAALILSLTLCVYPAHGSSLPAPTLNLFKNCISCSCLTALSLATGAAWPSDWRLYLWFAASGLVGFVLSDTALLAALKRIGASRTAALQCLSPPITALCGWLF